VGFVLAALANLSAGDVSPPIGEQQKTQNKEMEGYRNV